MKKIFKNCTLFVLIFIFFISLNFLTLPKSFATEFGRPSIYSGENFYTGLEYYGCYYKQRSTALILYNLIRSDYLTHKSGEMVECLGRTDMIFNAVTHWNSNDKNIELLNKCYNEYLNYPIVSNRIACCHFCNKLRENHIQTFLIGTKESDILSEENDQEFVVYILEKNNSELEYWAAKFDESEIMLMPIKDFVKMGYKITYYFEPADGMNFVFDPYVKSD